MSDLQCAAIFVVVDTAADGEALRSRRAAAVCATPGTGEAATGLARLLDLPRRDLPGAPTSPEALVRALDDVADEYLGECVAVVVTELAPLARLVLPGEEVHAVVVEIDADGRRWAALSGARAR